MTTWAYDTENARVSFDMSVSHHARITCIHTMRGSNTHSCIACVPLLPTQEHAVVCLYGNAARTNRTSASKIIRERSYLITVASSALKFLMKVLYTARICRYDIVCATTVFAHQATTRSEKLGRAAPPPCVVPEPDQDAQDAGDKLQGCQMALAVLSPTPEPLVLWDNLSEPLVAEEGHRRRLRHLPRAHRISLAWLLEVVGCQIASCSM